MSVLKQPVNVRSDDSRPIVIIVPFYRNAHLVVSFMQALQECREELSDLRCHLFLINDSPEDPELAKALDQAIRSAADWLHTTCVENNSNVGFVKSANTGLRFATQLGADAILINSDAMLSPGALAAMRSVAYREPNIGFVSPRSNNATIASLPHGDRYACVEPREGRSNHQVLSRFMPELQFVPTIVGFCVFIKYDVLCSVGLLDEIYGRGYNEENDLVMRANRAGYVAALANRAYVHHLGEISFSSSDEPKSVLDAHNAVILDSRYPEYRRAVTAYYSGPEYQAERLLDGLLPDEAGRLGVVFDLIEARDDTPDYVRIVSALAESSDPPWTKWFRTARLDSSGMHPYRGLTAGPFAIAIHAGDLPNTGPVRRMSFLAPINIYLLSGTCAFDSLGTRAPADAAMRLVFQHSDGIAYTCPEIALKCRSRFRNLTGIPEQVLDDDVESLTCPHRPYDVLVLVDEHSLPTMVSPQSISAAFPELVVAEQHVKENGASGLKHFRSGIATDDCWRINSIRQAVGIVCPAVEHALERASRLVALHGGRVFVHRGASGSKLPHFVTPYTSREELLKRIAEDIPRAREDRGVTASSVARLIAFLKERITQFELGRLVDRLQMQDANAVRPDAGPAQCHTGPFLAALADRNRRIEELERSISWRMTAPLRKAGDLCRRIAVLKKQRPW